jgi:hypothetical protein
MFRSLSLILSNKFNLVLQCRDFHARIQNFEIARDELDHRTKEIHETLLDQQTRSMKYNLIFENIPEEV